MRAELVEATLLAIDEFGPDLSIDDVLKIAQVPRPKLYRFFDDKNTLFIAVGERVQELILERVIPEFDRTVTALELVRSALTAYVGLVDERPNIFRFVIGSHFRDLRSPAEFIDTGRPLSDAAVAAVAAILRVHSEDADIDHLEYVVDAALGAVGLGVLRWLNEPTVDKAALVDQLTTFLWGALSATARVRGVLLDPDVRPADLD